MNRARKSGWQVAAVAVALTFLCGAAASGNGFAQSRGRLVPRLYSSASFDSTLPARLLDAHNRARAAVGVPALRWDPGLAAAASSYGPALATLGRLQHSPRGNRPGQAENLWMGSRGAYTPEQMVSYWVDERRQFRAGVFPAVTTTGNWADVGHYSQMIWPSTTAVGCAIHRSGGWDFLICRYTPKGNVDGQRVG